MALDLLTRAEKGSLLTIVDHDSNMLAIQNAINSLFPLTGSGPPSTVESTFIGQEYIDTSTDPKSIYKSDDIGVNTIWQQLA